MGLLVCTPVNDYSLGKYYDDVETETGNAQNSNRGHHQSGVQDTISKDDQVAQTFLGGDELSDDDANDSKGDGDLHAIKDIRDGIGKLYHLEDFPAASG